MYVCVCLHTISDTVKPIYGEAISFCIALFLQAPSVEVQSLGKGWSYTRWRIDFVINITILSLLPCVGGTVRSMYVRPR